MLQWFLIAFEINLNSGLWTTKTFMAPVYFNCLSDPNFNIQTH